jgi:hypothetical protein
MVSSRLELVEPRPPGRAFTITAEQSLVTTTAGRQSLSADPTRETAGLCAPRPTSTVNHGQGTTVAPVEHRAQQVHTVDAREGQRRADSSVGEQQRQQHPLSTSPAPPSSNGDRDRMRTMKDYVCLGSLKSEPHNVSKLIPNSLPPPALESAPFTRSKLLETMIRLRMEIEREEQVNKPPGLRRVRRPPAKPP